MVYLSWFMYKRLCFAILMVKICFIVVWVIEMSVMNYWWLLLLFYPKFCIHYSAFEVDKDLLYRGKFGIQKICNSHFFYWICTWLYQDKLQSGNLKSNLIIKFNWYCMISKNKKKHTRVITRIINQSHKISTLSLKLMHPKNFEISRFNTALGRVSANFKMNNNGNRFFFISFWRTPQALPSPFCESANPPTTFDGVHLLAPVSSGQDLPSSPSTRN